MAELATCGPLRHRILRLAGSHRIQLLDGCLPLLLLPPMLAGDARLLPARPTAEPLLAAPRRSAKTPAAASSLASASGTSIRLALTRIGFR
jgi:hypothetical protein